MTINGTYTKTENFEVVDAIGTPHPYTITARHVEHAADRFSGRLGEDAIVDGEKKGIRCGWRGCRLDYRNHEQALVVACKKPMADDGKTVCEELHGMLLANKAEAEKNGYSGFAFVRAKGYEGAL